MWMPLHKMPSFLNYRKKKKIVANNFLLDHPKTEKLSAENKILNGIEAGHSSMQGYRVNMEDQHIIDKMSTIPDHTLLAIMDGHAGKVAAKYTAAYLSSKIESSDPWKEYLKLNVADRRKRTDLIEKSLVHSYKAIDESLRVLRSMDNSGCTAVCAVVTPWHIICANVGDSRCVVGSSGATIAMTDDHKPSNPPEKKRIELAGGFVSMDRVNGELAMSRALGDFRYKEDPNLDELTYPVICYPDITVHERNEEKDEVMVLACDGVWDVLSNDEAVHYLTDIVFFAGGESAEYFQTTTTEGETEEVFFGVDGGVSVKKTSSSASVSASSTKKRKRVEIAADSPDTAATGGDDAANVGSSGGNDVTTVSSMEAAESLIELALSEGSTDNISAIVVKFPKLIRSKL